jgi:hypothetical protein
MALWAKMGQQSRSTVVNKNPPYGKSNVFDLRVTGTFLAHL